MSVAASLSSAFSVKKVSPRSDREKMRVRKGILRWREGQSISYSLCEMDSWTRLVFEPPRRKEAPRTQNDSRHSWRSLASWWFKKKPAILSADDPRHINRRPVG